MSAPDANGWMPIETAPLNEPIILASQKADGRWEVVAGFHDESPDVMEFPWPFIDTGCAGNFNAFHEDFGPTHWQPLPKPPIPSNLNTGEATP